MSKWTANWKPGVLKRSAAYQAFVERDETQRRADLKRQNWKAEQIALVKKQRAIAARLNSRAEQITAEASPKISNHDQPKTTA
jgi:hypothetical protein